MKREDCENIKKTTVMITGGTGVMGSATVEEFLNRLDRFNLRLLVRPSKRNKKKMKRFADIEGITVIWGDLLEPESVEEAMRGADFVLHMGGMVSPMADHYPEKTLKVNVEAAKILVDTAKKMPNRDELGFVNIGSVAITSLRMPPLHWGRTGDPVASAVYDTYSLSKIKAERIIAESGLKRWVSLRQSGILHKGLIFHGTDPISFHVPLKGVLEWATVEDSARLMANLCEKGTPDGFWRKFYNIGSGAAFRLTNYRFEQLLMKALGCPPPEKVFETGWFATRNFHGEWYEDSDVLDEMFHFRESISAEDYFKRMASQMPWWISLTPLAPAFLIKFGMKQVAKSRNLGTLDWLRRDDLEEKVRTYFGSREEQKNIPGWDEIDLSEPSQTPVRLSHGYDESKPDEMLDLEDMRKAAEFRGGKCLSERMVRGDLDSPLMWECSNGHRFSCTPRTVLKGGHWCDVCLEDPWHYDEERKKNPFLAQLWPESDS